MNGNYKCHDRLTGQVALVTGANSGIGEAIAKALAGEGASIGVNFVKNESEADRVVKEIESAGGNAIKLKGDVSVEQEVKNMFARLVERFETIHILVNNAGIQRDAPFANMTLEQWNNVINVNLTGQFLCSKEAVRYFLKRGLQPEISLALGKIICISSVHEIIPWAGHVNYAASKGGVLLFMKSLAQELAPMKIRVNGIAPGAIKTPINQDAWSTAEAKRNLLELIPYNRIGEPQDVGKVAVWLASDESDYINGASIVIDGGMTLYPGFATGG